MAGAERARAEQKNLGEGQRGKYAQGQSSTTGLNFPKRAKTWQKTWKKKIEEKGVGGNYRNGGGTYRCWRATMEHSPAEPLGARM